MRTEILAVGTEILLGQIADTNSAHIAQELSDNGIYLYGTSTVGDNLNRIVESMRYCLSKCDALIVTGGLGPTQDDITRQAASIVMGVELEQDPQLVDIIEGFFKARNRQMPANNLLQALVPKGASYIEQRRGTAPGLICGVGNKVMYCLPGVPHEMKEMLSRAVIPDLLLRTGEKRAVKYSNIMTWGMSESAIAAKLSEEFDRLETMQLENQPNTPSIAFLANLTTGVKVRISVSGQNTPELDSALNNEVSKISEILGDCVFSATGESIEDVVKNIFISRNLTLSFVESLTGGLIGSRLVGIPGASVYFKGSLVAYQSEIKHSVLKIQSESVVSALAVNEMAKAGLNLFNSDVCLAISGVAGPDSQEGKEPGTVYIGLCCDGDKLSTVNVEPVELKLFGTRDSIRQIAATSALDLLRKRVGLN